MWLRNGWGASAIDALSTAIIMDDVEAVNQILGYVPTIDFSKQKRLTQGDTVSLFETTIRYLGGLLAGYDMLNNRWGIKRSLVRQGVVSQKILVYEARLIDFRMRKTSFGKQKALRMLLNTLSTRRLVFHTMT